jgi:hypothetical protein
MQRIDFNINNYVLVKLTNTGKNILKTEHDKMAADYPMLGEYKPPFEDHDGYSRWQMWDIMGKLGSHCGHGFSLPFDTNILFEIDK